MPIKQNVESNSICIERLLDRAGREAWSKSSLLTISGTVTGVKNVDRFIDVVKNRYR